MKKLLLSVLTLGLLSSTDTFAVLVFWDMNGIAAGSGGPTPTGTWSADALNWNTNGAGGGVTGPEKWGNGNFAVFAAGNDATGAYTVYVSNVVKVADIHVDLGIVTFEPDPSAGGALKLSTWDDVNADRLLSVGHKDPNATAIYNVVLTNANGIIRYKRGTVVFGVTNQFTGPVKIEGGIIQLGVPYAIDTNSPLVLANDNGREDVGWIGLTMNTPATFATGGFSQKLGPLNLNGPVPTVPRTIDLGNGVSALAFEDSSTQTWLSTEGSPVPLHIVNYTPGVDSLRFGTSSAGLTATQLSQMQFADFLNLPGVIDTSGYVTPALPRITAITHSGGSVQLTWTAVNGRTYRVWSRDQLTTGTWDNPSDVPATGDTASHTDSTPSPTSRFYRVEVLP